MSYGGIYVDVTTVETERAAWTEKTKVRDLPVCILETKSEELATKEEEVEQEGGGARSPKLPVAPPGTADNLG